jgi:hypothetical protein
MDSSTRLEEVLARCKIAKKGTCLYLQGVELPLNSSLATHNVQNGDILETCSSSLLSAVLSAVISDLEAVQQGLEPEERTKEALQPLLDYPSLDEPEDWSLERWSFENVKRRSICLKMIKQVLQRNNRFENLQVPSCPDLETLYNFIMDSHVFAHVREDGNFGFSSMEQCFKPSARNRNGKPSVCWELVQLKLNKFLATTARVVGEDLIEAFVRAETNRHGGTVASNHNNSSSRTNTPQASNRTRTQRSQRRVPSLTPRTAAPSNILCAECHTTTADAICIVTNCPFVHQPFCFLCFAVNHPAPHRSLHEPVSVTDDRAKTVLRQQLQPSNTYCPEYASGPFCILVTLYNQTTNHSRLCLTERRLKELAQPTCRSNLYDRQARGRTAFACIENLCRLDLIRKEIIPGVPEDESAKYSLLPKGEELAKYCHQFEQAFQAIVSNNADIQREQNLALYGTAAERLTTTDIKILIDNREDNTFAQRLMDRSASNGIAHDRRELPAGDYLFVTTNEELVLPLVIERKTWSDLADSVRGHGRRRLDCVKIGIETTPCDARCQLCRMKRSQCPRIMFIIEGARCLKRDGQENKCSDDKICRYCQELNERHRVTQSDLEKIIYRLQVEHQCLVHFTRGYNETITSLFLVRDIFAAGVANGDNDYLQLPLALSVARAAGNSRSQKGIQLFPDMSYSQFCRNVRSFNVTESRRYPPKGKIVQLRDSEFVTNVYRGKICDAASQLLGEQSSVEDAVPSDAVVDLIKEQEVVDLLEESQDSIEILEVYEPESQNSVQVIEHLSAPPKEKPSPKRGRNQNQEDRTKIKVARLEEGKTSLLLLSGLYEYDTEFYSDTNKLWKSLFQDKDAIADFVQSAKDKLRAVQQAKGPLVERNALLFWMFYLQLRYDRLLIHTTRDSRCGNEMESLWKGAERPIPRHRERARSPRSIKNCGICARNLVESDSEALACGHCFHGRCVRHWWAAIRSRKCPTCNKEAPKDDGTAGPSEAPQFPRSAPSYRGNVSRLPIELSPDARIREARLRRFGEQIHGLPPSGRAGVARMPQAGPRSGWSCKACTYTNDAGSLSCVMCDSNRDASTANGELTEPLARATGSSTNGWDCPRCTLENDSSNSQCTACSFSLHAVVGLTPVAARQPDSRTPDRATPVLSSSVTHSASSLRKVKCGACGLMGHNRSNYTPEICPSYFYEAEVNLRQKKKEAEQQKQLEAQQRIEELEAATEAQNDQIQQLQRILADVHRAQQTQGTVAASEVNRLKKLKARAEKRAERLG